MPVKSFVALVFAGFTWGVVLAPAIQAQTPVPVQPAAAPGGPVRELTIEEAVRLALEQNLDVQVERLNPRIQDENVAFARSSFLPALSSNLAYNNSDSPPDSFLSGSSGGDILKADSVQTIALVRQQLPWGGGNYAFGWDATRATSNSIFTNFNPRLSSNLQFSFVQPLLRNFDTDTPRTQLLISRRNRDISDVTLRGRIVQTVRDVKNAYWNLKYALANLQAHQQSLDLAQQTLKDNRTRVRVGTMAPIDIVEAEAEVARNEEAVILAGADIQRSEDALRALVFDPDSPDFWEMQITPVDTPLVEAVPIDVGAAVRAALDKRTDLQNARQGLVNVADNLRLYRNQVLPQVNLQLDYRTTGLGGTQFERGDGFPGPVIGEVTRGFTNVLGDVFRSNFPTWTFGVVVSYPVGRSNAEASLARTELEQTQAQLQIRNIELQVAREVRETARQVTTNVRRIDATRAARVLSERRLEAEQKKFSVGMSTSFLVFQAQRDLAAARANELSAILDYNKALADFEAVQETALSGQGGGLGTSSAAVAGNLPVTASTTGPR
jgi:outer membrane protein TolC